MNTYKNTRPTILQLPSGKNVGPGEMFEADETTMANPGMRVFVSAGFVVPMAGEVSAPSAPQVEDRPQVLQEAAEKSGKAKREAKIAAIRAADAETLMSLADGETNADVLAALESRAAELAPK